MVFSHIGMFQFTKKKLNPLPPGSGGVMPMVMVMVVMLQQAFLCKKVAFFFTGMRMHYRIVPSGQ